MYYSLLDIHICIYIVNFELIDFYFPIWLLGICYFWNLLRNFGVLGSSKGCSRISRNFTLMENSSTMIGPRGLIKKYEFVRVIVQCLYSLGYQKSASCLESESGVSYKSKGFERLEVQILNGDWDGCIDTLIAITDLNDERRASVLFLVFKQCFLEYLNRGDDSLALNVLRKRVSSLQMSKDKIHNLASSMLCVEGMNLGKIDEGVVLELRKRLLVELERLLPPPEVVPERRLEHLVETAVTSQIDSCQYHNSSVAISLYEDHCCGRDQIPTETVQVCILLQLKSIPLLR